MNKTPSNYYFSCFAVKEEGNVIKEKKINLLMNDKYKYWLCAICLREYNEIDEDVMLLKCDHMFCRNCLETNNNKTKRLNYSCPTCKANEREKARSKKRSFYYDCIPWERDFYFFPLYPSYDGIPFPIENEKIIQFFTDFLSDLLMSHFYDRKLEIKGISKDSIERCMLACDLNFGIPTMGYMLCAEDDSDDDNERKICLKPKENILWTERGINLESVIEYGLLKDDDEVWNELSEIEETLKHFSLAHCNINERNIVYYMGHLKLTHNENLTRYNEKSSFSEETEKSPHDLYNLHLRILSARIQEIEIDETKNNQEGFNKLKNKLKEIKMEVNDDYLNEDLLRYGLSKSTICEELKIYIIKNKEILVMKNSEMLINKFYPNKILIPIGEFTKILEDQLYPNIISVFIKEKSDFCLKAIQENLSEKYKSTFQKLEQDRNKPKGFTQQDHLKYIKDIDQRMQSFTKCEQNAKETFHSRLDRQFRKFLLDVFSEKTKQILKDVIHKLLNQKQMK